MYLQGGKQELVEEKTKIKFMADLLNPICVSNKKYEVLTDEGFKDFKGLLIGDNPNRLEITINNTIKLRCTPQHKLVSSDKSIVYAENIDIGYVLYNNYIITDKRAYTDTDKVYELLEVKDTHRYFTNNILSHQCIIIDEMAFIEPESILEDFWRSVFPTISRSKKSKVLIASTPNGTGNLFHKLYDGAEKGDNGFVYEKIIWSEVPGRDEKWKNEQLKALGSMESFLQEYEVQFLSLGDSSIDEALFYDLSQKCSDPKIVLDDGHYKIWEEPDSSRVYVAGVDISEGVGVDASVIQIFDITDLRAIRQVAVYHNRQIPPLEFTNKLHTILKNWGSPLALIERNNCGAQVVDRLAFDIGYEKVVSYGAKVANRERPQMGMIAHTNTKYKGVMNMRYFINETRVVEFRDIETLKEFKEFVRYPNGVWKAKSGYHDDRVMSTIYALYILEKELTERYFDILELDDQGKPCSIEPMDFGIAMFENPTSIYNDFEVIGSSNQFMTPIVFGMGNGSEAAAEIDWLQQEGWKPLM
jgi:hypothetical protein